MMIAYLSINDRYSSLLYAVALWSTDEINFHITIVPTRMLHKQSTSVVTQTGVFRVPKLLLKYNTL